MTFVQSKSLRGAGIPVSACAVACVFALIAQAQNISRKPLDHKDYDVWNTLSNSSLSGDGKWVLYSVQNGAIDGEASVHIHNTKTAREYVIERGADAKFTYDSRHAIYRITPGKKKLKELRKEKKKSEELPKAKLQILDLDSGDVTTIENAKSFKVPEENGEWVSCLIEKPTGPGELDLEKTDGREIYEVTREGLRRPEKKLKLKSRKELAHQREAAEQGPSEEAEPRKENRKETVQTRAPAPERESKQEEDDDDDDEKQKEVGTPLILIHLESGIQRTFPDVSSFVFSKNGKAIALTTSVEAPEKHELGEDNAEDDQAKASAEGEASRESPDNGPVDGVHVINLDSLQWSTIIQGQGEYKNLAFNEDGSLLSFITNKDDFEAETSSWALYLWTSRGKTAKQIADEDDKGIPKGWWVAPDSNQRFSEDGRRLYFDTAPVPDDVVKQREAKAQGNENEEDDDEDEEAKLDVWHWQDPQLQPQQLLEAKKERSRNYRAAYVLKSKRIVQLATREVPDVEIDLRSPSDIAVANTNIRYRKALSWDVPGFQDAYLVNLDTGGRELALQRVKWDASMSPEGKFIVWFDGERKSWFAKATSGADGESIEISKGIQFPLHDELHDRPSPPRAYGIAGWTIDDNAILVYDRFDIWQLDPTGQSQPVCVTSGFGREKEVRFRYRRLDPKQRAIDPEKPMLLGAFRRMTKASGFYLLTLAKDNEDDSGNGVPLRKLIMLDEDLDGLQKAEKSEKVIFTRSTFRSCPDLWSSTTDFKKIYRVSDINPQQDEYSWGAAELVHWKSTDGQDLDGILLKPDDFDPSRKYPMMVYFYERNSDNLHRYYPPAAGRSIICHSFYVSRGYLVFIPDIPYTTGQPGQSAANSIIPGVEHLIDRGFVAKEKIGMQGHSWGGYQTAYLVTQTDMFACAESGAPVSNMTSAYGGIRWGSGLSRMFQYERTQSRIGDDLWSARDKYIANSPLFFADKINTPLLILHNDDDGAVPWYQGIELFVALRRLEKPAWMLNYNGNPHWVMGEPNRRDFAIRMQQFFDHYLKDAPEPEWMAVGVPAVEKGKNFGLELLEPENEKEESETEQKSKG